MIANLFSGRRLRKAGVIGINERNVAVISQYNERRYYPLVDNKLVSKKLAIEAGIRVPELYQVISTQHDIGKLREVLLQYQDFVIKPVSGSGGKGILVITGRRHGTYLKASGSSLRMGHIEHYVSNILSGLYSLGGKPDSAMIEYRVKVAPVFDNLTVDGVPDIRTIVFRGVPIMAMMRIPTIESDGKANLHQGAVGVGIDIDTGICNYMVHSNKIIKQHPDTLNAVDGMQIPQWDELLQLASSCFDIAKLGYMGVDFVFDKDYGPMMLEMNARPGLSIQIANGMGLRQRINTIQNLDTIPPSVAERVELTHTHFPSGA